MSNRHRAILSPAQVLQIFQRAKRGTSSALASEYGVSPKAIRDIWNGRFIIHSYDIACAAMTLHVQLCAAVKWNMCRTWSHVTASLEHKEEDLLCTEDMNAFEDVWDYQDIWQ